MKKFEIFKYYSRSDIQKAMILIAKDREVVGSFEDGSFSKRPDTLVYPKDVIERVKSDVVAFHCSVEKWKQPMQLSSNLTQKELNKLRKGFDFILDIDSKSKLEHAAIAAQVVYNFLKDRGIRPTIKFSGSRGFHLAISEEAFPNTIDFKKTSIQYPEIPKILAEFIRENIKDQLLEELIKYEGGVASLVRSIPSVSELSPYEFIEIEKDWGNRHLFRMPYSLHTKTWLVSLPIRFEELENFKTKIAKPKNVKTNVNFLINREEEANEFLLESLDWKAKQPKKIIKKIRIIKTKTPVSEKFFPPCIKLILKGLSDGRKRSLFTLATFLSSVNWNQDKIEKRMVEWNKKNKNPLTDRLLKTQLKWHFRQTRKLMPANCKSNLFYKSIGVCKPDNYCWKNPVNYPFRTMRKLKKAKK